MGPISAAGAILIITGWFALIEFDSYPESERKQILQRIKSSPALIALIALMPAGILINILGSSIGQIWMVILGATFIFLQGVIVSLLLFWKRKRWKSILLLVVIVAFGILMYMPLFL